MHLTADCDSANILDQILEKVNTEVRMASVKDEESNSLVSTDPRVQVEIENLNTSTEFINKLELELEKARAEFNKLLSESTQKIQFLSHKYETSICKARPFYETRATAQDLHARAQEEAVKYEQAIVEHEKAKETVHLAEQKLKDGVPKSVDQQPDAKWTELLNKSSNSVNKAELERLAAERQHEITSKAYNLTEQKLSRLHNQLKRSIVKASLETRRNLLDMNNYANQHHLQLLPYFEMKAQFNQMLEEQVTKIRSYEDRVNQAKANYSKALQRLEEVNSQIYSTSSSSCHQPQSNITDSSLPLPSTSFPVSSQNDENSAISPGTSNGDGSIFDHELLSQLELDDNIDSIMDELEEAVCKNTSTDQDAIDS